MDYMVSFYQYHRKKEKMEYNEYSFEEYGHLSWFFFFLRTHHLEHNSVENPRDMKTFQLSYTVVL